MSESHGTAYLLYHENGGNLFALVFFGAIVVGVGFWAISYQYGYPAGEAFAGASGLCFLAGGFVWFERIRAAATGDPHAEINAAGFMAKDVWYVTGEARLGETLFHTDNFMLCPKCRYQDEILTPQGSPCPKCKTPLVLDSYGLAWVRILPLIGKYDFSDIWPDASLNEARFMALYYFGEWTQRVGRGRVMVIKDTLPFFNKQSEKFYVRPVRSPLPEQIEEKFGPMPQFQVMFTSYGDAETDMEEFNMASREIAAKQKLRGMGIALPQGMKAWDYLKLAKKHPEEAVAMLANREVT